MTWAQSLGIALATACLARARRAERAPEIFVRNVRISDTEISLLCAGCRYAIAAYDERLQPYYVKRTVPGCPVHG